MSFPNDTRFPPLPRLAPQEQQPLPPPTSGRPIAAVRTVGRALFSTPREPREPRDLPSLSHNPEERPPQGEKRKPVPLTAVPASLLHGLSDPKKPREAPDDDSWLARRPPAPLAPQPFNLNGIPPVSIPHAAASSGSVAVRVASAFSRRFPDRAQLRASDSPPPSFPAAAPAASHGPCPQGPNPRADREHNRLAERRGPKNLADLREWAETSQGALMPILGRNYELVEKIGGGTFSNVYLVKDQDGNSFALKLFKKNHVKSDGTVRTYRNQDYAGFIGNEFISYLLLRKQPETRDRIARNYTFEALDISSLEGEDRDDLISDIKSLFFEQELTFAYLVEYIPREFPKEFDPQAPHWIQLRELIQVAAYQAHVYIDLADLLNNVKLNEEGNLVGVDLHNPLYGAYDPAHPSNIDAAIISPIRTFAKLIGRSADEIETIVAFLTPIDPRSAASSSSMQ